MIDAPAPDKYQEIFRKTVSRRLCYMAHWELTYACNLKCRHCYIAPSRQKKEFTLAQAKGIIDGLAKSGCLYLGLSGGEILCRPDFFEIASYARQKRFALRLLTNGTLIDKACAQKIAALSPLSLDMSIYAGSAALHDRITKAPGSFAKTTQAVLLLKKLKIPTALKFLAMRDNWQEFSKAQNLAKSLGARFFYDPCVVTKDDGSRKPLRWRLKYAQLKEFFLSNSPASGNIEEKENLFCAAGMNNISIDPYLDVYPCVALKIKLGSLARQSLDEIWRNSRPLGIIRGIKESDLKKCPQCRIKQYCFRCPGIALAEDQDWLGPSSFDCKAAKIISEFSQNKRRNHAHK